MMPDLKDLKNVKNNFAGIFIYILLSTDLVDFCFLPQPPTKNEAKLNK